MFATTKIKMIAKCKQL